MQKKIILIIFSTVFINDMISYDLTKLYLKAADVFAQTSTVHDQLIAQRPEIQQTISCINVGKGRILHRDNDMHPIQSFLPFILFVG